MKFEERLKDKQMTAEELGIKMFEDMKVKRVLPKICTTKELQQIYDIFAEYSNSDDAIYFLYSQLENVPEDKIYFMDTEAIHLPIEHLIRFRSRYRVDEDVFQYDLNNYYGKPN